jgi:hypothetical protein
MESGSILELSASQMSSLFAGLAADSPPFEADPNAEFSSSQLSQLFAGLSNSSWKLAKTGDSSCEVTGMLELDLDKLLSSITPRTQRRAERKRKLKNKKLLMVRKKREVTPPAVKKAHRVMMNREYACRSRKR